MRLEAVGDFGLGNFTVHHSLARVKMLARIVGEMHDKCTAYKVLNAICAGV
jgi:hypothetical protein